MCASRCRLLTIKKRDTGLKWQTVSPPDQSLVPYPLMQDARRPVREIKKPEVEGIRECITVRWTNPGSVDLGLALTWLPCILDEFVILILE